MLQLGLAVGKQPRLTALIRVVQESGEVVDMREEAAPLERLGELARVVGGERPFGIGFVAFAFELWDEATLAPTPAPTTTSPTREPTSAPTTSAPTLAPSFVPTSLPTIPTLAPSLSR